MPKFGTARLPLAGSEPDDEPDAGMPAGPARVTELKVGGHLMTLDVGLFCVFHAPGSTVAESGTGLPGVRISVAPGHLGRLDSVQISTFRNDGWLTGNGDAALIRVTEKPAQILVTVYQSPQSVDPAPRLQVLQLSASTAAAAVAPRPVPAPVAVPAQAPREGDVVAHVQRTGDTGVKLGDWIGTRGSQRWIEGFSISPTPGIASEDVEYQAVLGRGWVSPWVKGGEFCGSRGMALPILGLRVRLAGAAGAAFDCTYAATFVDGSSAGPVAQGAACEAESLAPLEAFQVLLAPRARQAAAAATPLRKDMQRPAPRLPTAQPQPLKSKVALQPSKPIPGGRTR